MLSNITNPKLVVFFLTFIPQFISDDGSYALQTFGLAAAFAAIGLTAQVIVALGTDRVRGALERPRVQMRMEQVTGVALIAIGAGLALTRR